MQLRARFPPSLQPRRRARRTGTTCQAGSASTRRPACAQSPQSLRPPCIAPGLAKDSVAARHIRAGTRRRYRKDANGQFMFPSSQRKRGALRSARPTAAGHCRRLRACDACMRCAAWSQHPTAAVCAVLRSATTAQRRHTSGRSAGKCMAVSARRCRARACALRAVRVRSCVLCRVRVVPRRAVNSAMAPQRWIRQWSYLRKGRSARGKARWSAAPPRSIGRCSSPSRQRPPATL